MNKNAIKSEIGDLTWQFCPKNIDTPSRDFLQKSELPPSLDFQPCVSKAEHLKPFPDGIVLAKRFEGATNEYSIIQNLLNRTI
jgi:hypothetical protein